MAGNGMSQIGRFTSDFIILTGATDGTLNMAVLPFSNNISHGMTSGDTNDITFVSSYPFPGSGKVANAARRRLLAMCVKVYWAGTEQSRSGVVSFGNVPLGSSPLTGVTPREIASSVPYTFRFPDAGVGIKWRPSEQDLEWRQGSLNNGWETGIYLTCRGLPPTVNIRFQITTVVEWEDAVGLTSGTPIQQYGLNEPGAQDLWSKAVGFLDKTGHWLLDNAEAVGHKAVDIAKLLM